MATTISMGLQPRLLFAALALAAGTAPSFAQAKDDRDVVQMRDGKSQSITIEAENWDAVVGKGSAPIPWDEVQAVEYANAPEFNKAIEVFKAGNHGSALQQFEVLNADPKLRKVFKQQIAFYSAFARQKAGKPDEAIAAYQELIKTYDKGRFHVRATEAMVDCMLAKKDTEGALKAVDTLVAAASSDPGFAAALGLVRARLLLDQDKPTDARQLFDAAVAAKGVPAWVGHEGQLGQAIAVFKGGNATDAELRFRTLTTLDASAHVLAGAWNGLGDIISARGRDKKDIDELLDALYCYLRGVTVYAPMAGDSTDQYERSLAGSAQCFGYVSDLEPNKERKAEYKKRATERKDLLKRDFPLSRYLKN